MYNSIGSINKYRFFWEGYTYILKPTKHSEELIVIKGVIFDKYTKIEKTIIGIDEILKFLQLRCVPMKEYLSIERVFMEEV
jgi:hypothetical protein